MKKTFIYLGLNEILGQLKKNDVSSVDIDLSISAGTKFYNNERFFDFCKNIREKFFNSERVLFDDSGNKFRLNKYRMTLCDSVSHYNLYFEYASKYMIENNLASEEKIPANIKEELHKKSKIDAKEQGQEWFSRNINSINELLPKDKKLSKDFKIGADIVTLYEGDKDIPKIELWSHDYYYHHPEFEKIKNALKEVCSSDENPVEKAFQYEVKYFIRRLAERGEEIIFEDFRIKQGYYYLFDEGVSYIIKHKDQNNLIEFYYGGSEPQNTSIFRHKKAQSDPIIQKYLQGPLKGADQRKFVSVKMVEE